ncbi:MAG: Asp-tRNA(Asn)/Glu-tRNA(Gln) amidotransferase subunit GatB [Candidatus Zhuqueibacterota bacterium]
MKTTPLTYEPVIGLEIHAQLETASKLFCGCSTDFGNPPNSQTCPVCLGLPGVLPVLNRNSYSLAMKMGLATHCRFNQESRFARKNYFYPDLPKGYQITQFEEPLCCEGFITIESSGESKKIGIIRIHLEEDAGKSIHVRDEKETLVDLNRCGLPLIEIVTAPDIRSGHEASQTLRELRRLLQYLEICNGNMELGNLRCDANISVRPVGDVGFGVSTEIKNLNSFRAIEKALDYEFHRQANLLRVGQTIAHATLLWDEKKAATQPMRAKEDASEYRYFPEPDLVPIVVDFSHLDKMKSSLPELPAEKRHRFRQQYKLSASDASTLTESRFIADYFEHLASLLGDAKLASVWILTEVLRTVKKDAQSDHITVPADRLARLLLLLKTKRITRSSAREIYANMLESGSEPEAFIRDTPRARIMDETTLSAAIDAMLSQFPAEVARFRHGELKLFDYFFGQVKKATHNKANPRQIQELLASKLAGK